MDTTASTLSLHDFTFSNDGKPVACPHGHAPLKTKKKKNRFSAVFASETCVTCPFIGECPAKAGRRGHYLRYDEKALRLAHRRAIEKTPDFIEKYRFRAGVEATMSQFDRRTGVKHLRVRGLKAVRLCAFLKAIGVNIFRAAAFKQGNNGGHSPPRDLLSVFYILFQLVKERLTSNSVFNVRNTVETGLAFQF